MKFDGCDFTFVSLKVLIYIFPMSSNFDLLTVMLENSAVWLILLHKIESLIGHNSGNSYPKSESYSALDSSLLVE